MDRPEFVLNPTSLRTDLDGLDPARLGGQLHQGNRHRPGHRLHPLPGGGLQRAELRPRTRAQPHRVDQARRRSLPSRRPSPPTPAKPTPAAPRSPCRARSSSNRPTSARSAPGWSVQRRRRPGRTLPRRLDLRLRQGDHPDHLRTARRPGLPALQRRRTKAPRPGRRPARGRDQHRPCRLRGRRPRRHPQHLPKASPTPRLQLHPGNGGRQQRPAGQLDQPLRRHAPRHGPLRRPQRQDRVLQARRLPRPAATRSPRSTASTWPPIATATGEGGAERRADLHAPRRAAGRLGRALLAQPPSAGSQDCVARFLSLLAVPL